MAGSDSNSSTSTSTSTAAAPLGVRGALRNIWLRFEQFAAAEVLRKDMQDAEKRMESDVCRDYTTVARKKLHDAIDAPDNNERFGILSQSSSQDAEIVPEQEVSGSFDVCDSSEVIRSFTFRAEELIRNEQAASLESNEAAAAYIFRNTNKYGENMGHKPYFGTLSMRKHTRFQESVRPALKKAAAGKPISQDELSAVDRYFELGSTCGFRFGHCAALKTLFSEHKPRIKQEAVQSTDEHLTQTNNP